MRDDPKIYTPVIQNPAISVVGQRTHNRTTLFTKSIRFNKALATQYGLSCFLPKHLLSLVTKNTNIKAMQAKGKLQIKTL